MKIVFRLIVFVYLCLILTSCRLDSHGDIEQISLSDIGGRWVSVSTNKQLFMSIVFEEEGVCYFHIGAGPEVHQFVVSEVLVNGIDVTLNLKPCDEREKGALTTFAGVYDKNNDLFILVNNDFGFVNTSYIFVRPKKIEEQLRKLKASSCDNLNGEFKPDYRLDIQAR